MATRTYTLTERERQLIGAALHDAAQDAERRRVEIPVWNTQGDDRAREYVAELRATLAKFARDRNSEIREVLEQIEVRR